MAGRIKARKPQEQALDEAQQGNYITVATKLTKEEVARFDQMCNLHGKNRYQFLQDLIRTVIQNIK